MCYRIRYMTSIFVSGEMLSISTFADLHCKLARAWGLGSEIVLYGKVYVN